MTAVVDVIDPSDLELRAHVDSLESLQHARRVLMPRYAQLAAKFRGGTTAGSDSARKRHRALTAKRILAEWPADQKEPSEAALERMANADDAHVKYCDAMEAECIEYVLLDNQIKEIGERIESRLVELSVFNSEVRLGR